MQTQRIVIALAGTALAATQGYAQSGDVIIEGGVPTAVVSYADLNLASPAGRLALDRRVDRAATGLCFEDRRAPVAELLAQRNCYSAALSRAQIDIQQAVARASNQLALQGSIKVAAR
jgi:UrcA family protein